MMLIEIEFKWPIPKHEDLIVGAMAQYQDGDLLEPIGLSLITPMSAHPVDLFVEIANQMHLIREHAVICLYEKAREIQRESA